MFLIKIPNNNKNILRGKYNDESMSSFDSKHSLDVEIF